MLDLPEGKEIYPTQIDVVESILEFIESNSVTEMKPHMIAFMENSHVQARLNYRNLAMSSLNEDTLDSTLSEFTKTFRNYKFSNETLFKTIDVLVSGKQWEKLNYLFGKGLPSIDSTTDIQDYHNFIGNLTLG